MFFGFDTSCYTTSLAVIDDQGHLLSDERKMLEVQAGGRGLRQSEALFQHLRNLPALAEAAGKKTGGRYPLAVAASGRPRPVDGSYMPVFTAGENFGRSLASLLRVPFYTLSHQEGHLLSGLWSAGVDWTDFLCVHISGGTTEVLAVARDVGFSVREVGGSADLQAGQFIDRVGVRLGLPFPAGPHLEEMARGAGPEILDVPVSVQGLNLSFSGPESYVQRVLDAGGYNPAEVARGVEHAVAGALFRLVRNARGLLGAERVLFVGGVAANGYIKNYLRDKLGPQAAFAQAPFAGDNAVGSALYGKLMYMPKTK